MADHWTPEIFRSALENLQTGVYLLDREGKIRFWNEGAERITGYHRHEVVGHTCQENVLADCDTQGCGLCGSCCPFDVSLHEGKSKEARMYFHHKAGHRVFVHLWSVPIRDEHGSIIAVAESFDELSYSSARNRRRSSLEASGYLDEATGVPNHGFTEFHLRENLVSFAQYRLPFGILAIQIDQLDRFRTAYGQEAFVALMTLVVGNIQNCIRPTDLLGRWQEDQFLIIATNCNRNGLEKVVQRVREVVSPTELQWWGDRLRVNVFVGHAAVLDDDSVESLLARAQCSLDQASGKGAPPPVSAAGTSAG